MTPRSLTDLLGHLPEELPEAPGLLEAGSALGRQLTELLITELQVSHAVTDDLRVTRFVSCRRGTEGFMKQHSTDRGITKIQSISVSLKCYDQSVT